MCRQSSIATALLAAAIFLIGFQPDDALAHKVSYVSIGASFETEERTFSIEMAMEVDPTEDAVVNAQISPEQAATTFATEVLSLYFGDTELSVTPKIRVIEPEPEDIDASFPERTKVVATLAGDIPEAADYFTLHLSEDNEATAIMVHFVDGDPGRRAEVLYPGEFSNPIYLRKTVKADPFQANAATATDGKGANSNATNPDTGEKMPDAEADEKALPPESGETDTGAGIIIERPLIYSMKQGFRQVLPTNFPLLVCLLTLFFFRRQLRVLLVQGLTLVIFLCIGYSPAAFGTISLGGHTEWLPLAFLIGTALLALENLFHNKLRWWRMIVIGLTGTAVGLWHYELSLSGLHVGNPLLSPPPGVVACQLLGTTAAIALVFAVLRFAVAGMWTRPWYRKSVAFPASMIALGLSLFWILSG